METLQQFFITVIATFVFLILIARITIATTNDNRGHHILKSSLNEKTSTKTNTKKKKVRFAIDDNDEYVVNKVVLKPSETQSVVFDEPMEDDLVIDYDQTEMISVEENVGSSCSKDEICVKLMCVDDDGIDEDLKEKEGLVSDEDDDSLDDGWEGIERSEWEKAFGFASSYGKVDDGLQSLESDAQMELYGLHKVATEGACHEAQPLAL